MRGRLLAYVLALTAALTLLGAGPAQAAGYRYWSFWLGEGGSWVYATEGPASARPADGSVTGYRFSVSEDSADSAQPRQAPDFEAVCGATPPRPGAKRIALVIDPGTAKDAPTGEQPPAPRTACAQVPRAATAADALAAVAKPLRYNSQALLCAISGYPRTGCGEQLSGNRPTPAASPGTQSEADQSDQDAGPSVGVLAGVAAILTLGGAALWQSRRRRR
ncbi:SCO2322 family protein [Streptomyces albipurpureus]|uniref:SCO2322 family protein n=1 Tax=Streptomyces albipurpureus TaxID=2897419 RepID=A0ABT0UJV5_9ACTN|nr:SCO2322 family protein [Streptomyces sp. CWNU-1]MCM2388724.1 SCO2322 family protein [Streptomyces sp. CWNU-1]